MSKLDFPDGWHQARIFDVSQKCEQRKPEDLEQFFYVDIGSINREIKRIESPQHLLGKNAPSRARKVIHKGDVLVSLTRPNLNAVALVPEEYDNQIASTGFEVIKPILIDSRYIFALTRSQNFIDAISGTVQGALYPATRPSDIQAYNFALPPLAEQRVIANKLDTLLAKVETTKTSLERIPDILKLFCQSVLTAAVSGKLTEEWRKNNSIQNASISELPENNKTRRGLPDHVVTPDSLIEFAFPKSWDVLPVAALLRKGVIIDLKDGNHGTNHPNSSEFTEEGRPFITAAQMRDNGNINYVDAPKVSGKPLEKLKVGFAEADDVIYSHKGTVGRVGIADRSCILSPQTTYIRLNPKYILNRYYAFMLKSHVFTAQVDAIKSQTTRDFVPITAHYSLFAVVPPITEQFEIVNCIEALFAFSDAIGQKANAALGRVNNLTQSILTKAFRGELTTNWRVANPDLISGENSAEALLKKIKSEREALKRQPKPKRPIVKKKTGIGMSKKIIKIVEALKQAGKPMSGQQLLTASGYPSDSSTEELEKFFLDIREALICDKSIVMLERSDNGQDWFLLVDMPT